MRAALFLDFDNFFSGLIAADPSSAVDIATSPARWLSRLTQGPSEEPARRWLVLRCYMNPAGWLPDPKRPGERLYFSKFRPFFTQAGVEVVDCPALTRGSKNGADIRIVIDVMTALRANTRYDEFVIASADADFTPLLQVLRADDRRVTVIATSSTATAYEALADRFLDEQDMFDLMLADPEARDGRVEEPGSPTAGVAPLPRQADTEADVDAQYRAFADSVRETYARATAPINMAQLASELRAQWSGATDGTWFGAGSFSRAVQKLELPHVRFSQYSMWDSTRHDEPPAAAVKASPPATVKRSVPPIVMNFAEVTGMPKVASDAWPVIYKMLEAYAAHHEYNFTEASKWSRDRAAAEGVEIPRNAFIFALRACQNEEANLDATPSPDAAAISQAVYASVLRRAEMAGLEVADTEKRELAAWIHAEGPDRLER